MCLQRLQIGDHVVDFLLLQHNVRHFVMGASQPHANRHWCHAWSLRDALKCGRMIEWRANLTRLMEGGKTNPSLPLDIRATAFQRRVWEALQRIPRGETRSYSAIAKKIGMPKATRAVARACATNPVAVAIPCHRVVRQDGELGGYRWGIERKEQLLALEKEAGA